MAEREEMLQARLDKISRLENEIKQKEKSKKQILLRLSPGLWEDIAKWAENDFRSINGQVEFILSKAVSEYRKKQ